MNNEEKKALFEDWLKKALEAHKPGLSETYDLVKIMDGWSNERLVSTAVAAFVVEALSKK